jgi:hypothetical protein
MARRESLEKLQSEYFNAKEELESRVSVFQTSLDALADSVEGDEINQTRFEWQTLITAYELQIANYAILLQSIDTLLEDLP